jgi:hypothetical protein
MKARRRNAAPELRDRYPSGSKQHLEGFERLNGCPLWVISGLMRRTMACPLCPNSDRESGHGRRTRRPDQTRACRAVGGGGLDCELYAQIRGTTLHDA